MERNVIVYFGMGLLPDYNAVACRQQALRFIIKEAGYIPVIIGINAQISFGEFAKVNDNDFEYHLIKHAKTLTEKIQDIFVIKKTLIHILESVGIDRIKCFIMQDYQLGPMKQMKRYCQKNGIAFVADIMDWFVPTRDYSLSKNIGKTIDTGLRMHFFYPFLKNKIYISHKFHQYFRDGKTKNTMVLPCTCVDSPFLSVQDNGNTGNLVVTFAGSLGKKFEKEKLDWIIRALYENKSDINLNVVGLTREAFEDRAPELSAYITEHICFWGRLPHTECLKIMRTGDFSIIARKSNKLTEFGFSSKICEAFAYAIPVIATNNSDNAIYVKNGINGYICDSDYESLKSLLKKVEKTNRILIQAMRRNVITDNPLNPEKYIDCFAEFVNNLVV